MGTKTKPPKPRARVKISKYPYGRVSKALRNAAAWINSNNSKIDCANLDACLPKGIYSRLYPEEFHFLEEQTFDRRDWFWHYGDE